MSNTTEIGKRGERRAKWYLRFHGYRILEQNYRSGHHEIDLIAWERKSRTIVFVEVKARVRCDFGLPREAVHAKKQHFLRLVALKYLQSEGATEQAARFDVIEVYREDGRIVHLKNAF